ncbi:MAG: hypothetical protein ACPGLV_09120 [Bacteroidia bacterium]
MKRSLLLILPLALILNSCTLPLIEELNRSVKDKVKKYMKNETFDIVEVHEIIEERGGWNMPFTVTRDSIYPMEGQFYFERERETRYDPVTFTNSEGASTTLKWNLYDESAEDDEPRLFFYIDDMMGKWEECPFEATEVYRSSDGLRVDEYGESILELSQDGVENRFSKRSLFIKLKLME